ncbi:hypothetical protein ACIQ34_10145 [Ureibacillus sp. NPDC094379]
MFKKVFSNRYTLPLAILLSAMFIFLFNPFANFAKESDIGIDITMYSNNELKQYHDKYESLMNSLRSDLSDHGYPLTVDFALLDDEKVEILIKRYEMNEELKSNEIHEVEQLVSKFLVQQHVEPSMFKISVSNTTQPVLKTANRLSYTDLTEYISNALTEEGIGGYHINYEILPVTTKIIMQFPNPLDRSQKEEIQQIAEKVLKKNNFAYGKIQIQLTNFLTKAENLPNLKQAEVDQFYEELQKEDGFMDQVGRALNKSGFMGSISGTVYAPNHIELFFDYPDDVEKQEEITSILENYMTKFNLNADAFHIQFDVDDLKS